MNDSTTTRPIPLQTQPGVTVNANPNVALPGTDPSVALAAPTVSMPSVRITPPTTTPSGQPPTLSVTPASYAAPTMPRQFASLGDTSWTGDPSFARAPPVTSDPGFVRMPGVGANIDPGINRLEDLPRYYEQYGAMYNVPPGILRGVAGAETSFGTNITDSSAGAKGLMQFVNETATKYGVNVNSFRSSVEGAAHYLHDLYQQYGSWPLALQAYNGALNDPSMSYARKVLGYAGQNMPPQRYVFASDTQDLANRPPEQWGRTPEGGYAENTLPQPGDFQGVMALGRKMLPFASGNSVYDQIAMLNFYGNYVKSYQAGQINQMKLSEEQFKLRLEQHQERMQEETQAYGEVVAANSSNPNAMLDQLADLAIKYDDKPMAAAVANGPDAVNALMQRRDAYYSDVSKTSEAVLKQQQDKQIEDAAQNDLAMWKADPANANATPQQAQAKLFDFRAARRNELLDKGASRTGDPTKAAELAAAEPAAKADLAQWEADPANANATQGQKDQQYQTFLANRLKGFTKSGADENKPGNFSWVDSQGKPQSGYIKPDPPHGFVDMFGNPVDIKPGTKPQRFTSTAAAPLGSADESAAQAQAAARDYPGKPDVPPPNSNIPQYVWQQALDWARMGRMPIGLSGRSGNFRDQVAQAVPAATAALGLKASEQAQQGIRFQAETHRRLAIETAFNSGWANKQMVSLNTVADHIGLFRRYAAALRTGNNTALTALNQEMASLAGYPEVPGFEIAKTMTGDEVVRLLTTSGGTITDREELARRMAASNSPDQFESVANAMTNYVLGRYTPLRTAYAAGDEYFGSHFDSAMVTPQARDLIKAGTRPIAGETTPPPPEPLPTWGSKWAKDPDTGLPVIVGNDGKIYDPDHSARTDLQP